MLIVANVAACHTELHPACVHCMHHQNNGSPWLLGGRWTCSRTNNGSFCRQQMHLWVFLNGERERMLTLSFKAHPINFQSSANLYITSTKALWRRLGQLKSPLSHIIILSTLQLFPHLVMNWHRESQSSWHPYHLTVSLHSNGRRWI